MGLRTLCLYDKGLGSRGLGYGIHGKGKGSDLLSTRALGVRLVKGPAGFMLLV